MVVQYMYYAKSDLEVLKCVKVMRDTLLEQGHTIPVDDYDSIMSMVQSNTLTTITKPKYDFEQRSYVISESDALIAETTANISSNGISIGLALSMGKPTLIVMHSEKKSQDDMDNASLKTLNHPLLTYKEYSSPEELQQIILEFLESINHRVRVRFNLVMDQNHDNYLTWAASQYDVSKTEVITTSITEKSERDEKYQAQRQQFLKRQESQNPKCV